MERGGFTFVNWRKKGKARLRRQPPPSPPPPRTCVVVLLIGAAVAASRREIKVHTPRSRSTPGHRRALGAEEAPRFPRLVELPPRADFANCAEALCPYRTMVWRLRIAD